MNRTDESYMALALREAEKGLYTAHPNPRVGCLLVKGDKVISKGFHLKTGTGHAEANALRAAAGKTQGCTAYVTLEPCSFEGRTPSCARSLIEAGVIRVVYAMTDPHPRNRGAGLELLRGAGIAVTGPVLEQSALALNPGHVSKYERGLPFVRLKLAMSTDGKTALANGESQWITGEAARRDVQRLRARSSAIVTGVQTVIDDDPRLTVRAVELEVPEASIAAEVERKIFVLDPEQRIPVSSRLFDSPNMILTTLKDPENGAVKDIEYLRLPDDGQRRINLRALLEELASRDFNEVLFECGATLAGSLVADRLVDELVIYMAPKLMGHEARSLLNLGSLHSMSDVTELKFTDIRLFGEDLRITVRIK